MCTGRQTRGLASRCNAGTLRQVTPGLVSYRGTHAGQVRRGSLGRRRAALFLGGGSRESGVGGKRSVARLTRGGGGEGVFILWEKRLWIVHTYLGRRTPHHSRGGDSRVAAVDLLLRAGGARSLGGPVAGVGGRGRASRLQLGCKKQIGDSREGRERRRRRREGEKKRRDTGLAAAVSCFMPACLLHGIYSTCMFCVISPSLLLSFFLSLPPLSSLPPSPSSLCPKLTTAQLDPSPREQTQKWASSSTPAKPRSSAAQPPSGPAPRPARNSNSPAAAPWTPVSSAASVRPRTSPARTATRPRATSPGCARKQARRSSTAGAARLTPVRMAESVRCLRDSPWGVVAVVAVVVAVLRGSRRRRRGRGGLRDRKVRRLRSLR